jgi:hypothetical protein
MFIGFMTSPKARSSARDDKGEGGISSRDSVARIPGLKRETWGTLRFTLLDAGRTLGLSAGVVADVGSLSSLFQLALASRLLGMTKERVVFPLGIPIVDVRV